MQIPRAWQLEQGQRVAVALRDNSVAHRRIQRERQAVQQQLSSISVVQPTDGHDWQAGKTAIPHVSARCTDDENPLREQASRHEPKYLSGWLIQPVSIVDQADERLSFGHFREQGQCRETDAKEVRRRKTAQPKRRREGITLRTGQPIKVLQHGTAQLMKAAVGKVHLRIDPDGSGNMTITHVVRHAREQHALANPRVAT